MDRFREPTKLEEDRQAIIEAIAEELAEELGREPSEEELEDRIYYYECMADNADEEEQ
jgi:hypothetical protein